MLPDLLIPNLKVVFCGTAVGNRSKKLQAYYAGKGNKFWRTLFEINLTNELFLPIQYEQLLNYYIGLTDLVKNKSGTDSILLKSDFGRDLLIKKIKEFQPNILCFNGKKSAKEYFLKDEVSYGLQKDTIKNTKIFVAPSTSSSADRFWDLSYWEILAELSNQ